MAEIGENGDGRKAVGDGGPEVEEGVEAAALLAVKEDGARLGGNEMRLGVEDRSAGKRKVKVESSVNLKDVHSSLFRDSAYVVSILNGILLIDIIEF